MLLGTINRDARLARYTAPQKSIPLIRLKVVPSSKVGMGLAKGHGRLPRVPAAQGWRPHAWRNPGRQRRRRAPPSSDGRTIVRFSRSLSWYTNVYQDGEGARGAGPACPCVAVWLSLSTVNDFDYLSIIHRCLYISDYMLGLLQCPERRGRDRRWQAARCSQPRSTGRSP